MSGSSGRSDQGTVPNPRVVEAGCLYPLLPGAVPAPKSQNEILDYGSMDRIGKNKCPLTQLGGLYIENPSCGLTRRNSSSSPLYNADKIFIRSTTDPGPLRPQRVASSSLLKSHMGWPLYWSGYTPRIMHSAITPIMVSPEWANNLIQPIR